MCVLHLNKWKRARMTRQELWYEKKVTVGCCVNHGIILVPEQKCNWSSRRENALILILTSVIFLWSMKNMCRQGVFEKMRKWRFRQGAWLTQGCTTSMSSFLEMVSYDSSSSALFSWNLNVEAFPNQPSNSLLLWSSSIILPFTFFFVAFLCSCHFDWFSHVCVFIPLETKSPENNNISCSPLFLQLVITAVSPAPSTLLVNPQEIFINWLL